MFSLHLKALARKRSNQCLRTHRTVTLHRLTQKVKVVSLFLRYAKYTRSTYCSADPLTSSHSLTHMRSGHSTWLVFTNLVMSNRNIRQCHPETTRYAPARPRKSTRYKTPNPRVHRYELPVSGTWGTHFVTKMTRIPMKSVGSTWGTARMILIGAVYRTIPSR